VTNGANFKPPIAYGSIGTLFGQHIVNAPGIVTASSLPLPTEINGVSVMATSITGTEVRLPLFAIANVNGQEQVNFQAPTFTDSVWGVAVISNGKRSVGFWITSPDSRPGIFTIDGSTGAIQHGSTYQPVTASNPAKRGEVLIIYATGLGAVSPDPGLGNPAASSPPAVTKTTPTVTIGGATAQVLFSGLAPGFVGLNQVNVQVPQGTASGNVDVVLTSGGSSSPPVKLPVESASQSAARLRRQR